MRLACLAVLLAAMALPSSRAQTLTNTGALSFGSFTAGSGGSVTVSAGGGRLKSGGVILVNQGSSASAAQFTVTGTPGTTIDITLPSDGVVVLSDGAAGTMAVNGFTSSPSGSGVLSGGGTLLISVGATLTVGSQQTPGNYAGSFIVTVNYQ